MKKFDKVTQLSEYKGFKALQKSVGGLATIDDKKLAKIAEKMVEIDRVNHTAGRSQTQTTNQLMSLTMMTDSPYRRLRQCMSQIERKRKALESSYFKMQKTKVHINQWLKKGEDMSVIKSRQPESDMIRQKEFRTLLQTAASIGVYMSKHKQDDFTKLDKMWDIPYEGEDDV